MPELGVIGVVATENETPAEAAQRRQQAQRLGVPEGVLQHMPGWAKGQIEAREFELDTLESPGVRGFALESPENAKALRHQYQQLAAVEAALEGSERTPGQQAVINDYLRRHPEMVRVSQMVRPLMPETLSASEAAVAGFQRTQAQIDLWGVRGRALGSASRDRPAVTSRQRT